MFTIGRSDDLRSLLAHACRQLLPKIGVLPRRNKNRKEKVEKGAKEKRSSPKSKLLRTRSRLLNMVQFYVLRLKAMVSYWYFNGHQSQLAKLRRMLWPANTLFSSGLKCVLETPRPQAFYGALKAIKRLPFSRDFYVQWFRPLGYK